MRLCILIGLLFSSAWPAVASDGLATRFPAAQRIVSFGDVHGDLQAARAVLKLAGAIDERDCWIGGNLVVVQTGDQLDRGNDELQILELFAQLAVEAKAAGGAFHVLNGNHEFMNAIGDFRYVTPDGFADFADLIPMPRGDSFYSTHPMEQRSRLAGMCPGGPYASLLAQRNTVVIVGDNVFAHGGILPQHVAYGLERLNNEIRAWLKNEGPRPVMISKTDSPTWTRRLSLNTGEQDCLDLSQALSQLGVKRLIVGHTVQKTGITSACNDQVWRVDVGMARHYGGPIQALEICGDRLRILEAQQ